MAPDGRVKEKARKSLPDKKDDNKDRNGHKVDISRKATVEVVVKVKRYTARNPPPNPPVAVPSGPTIYPKGSWGDLLTRHSKANQPEPVEPEKKDKYKIRRPKGCAHVHKDMRCDIVSEDEDEEIEEPPTYVCRTFPLTDQLYLETHTKVKDPYSLKITPRGETDVGDGDNVYKPHKADRNKKISDNNNGYEKEKDRDYVAENKAIRHEIKNMKLEITKIMLLHKIAQQEMIHLKAQHLQKNINQQKHAVGFTDHAAARSSRLKSKDKDFPPVSQPRNVIKHMGTSTTNLIASPPRSVARTSKDTQADIISPVKDMAMSTPVYVQSIDEKNSKEAVLMHENEALRQEANNLLLEMQKARLEHHDSIKTIKELHKAAERLKRENQQLITDQEQKQQLQDELLMALTENQELKTYLQALLDKRKEISQFSHENQDELVKLRGVIDEVRLEIEKEIQAASPGSQHSLYKKPEGLRGLDFNITEGDSVLLNDSNTSREIQQILGSGPRLQPSGNMSHLSDPGTARLRQKSLSKNAVERTRYRSSTPNGSSSSSSSSSRSSSSLSPVKPRLSSIPPENLITSICEEVCRSFRPIQLELDLSNNNKDKESSA